jgi:RNA polymerase sigma factor (TIGR02999 family)
LLQQLAHGNHDAAAKLIPFVYAELRRLAVRRLRCERPHHTLQATALVHEVYMKLVAQENAEWQNRAQFYAVASQAMRRILVDYARGQQRIKRGGKQEKVSLDDVLLVSRDRTEELLAVNESLSKLEKLDARQARIVELRFFGGLSIKETAKVLGMSTKTVTRDWLTARAWLQRQLLHKDEPSAGAGHV